MFAAPQSCVCMCCGVPGRPSSSMHVPMSAFTLTFVFIRGVRLESPIGGGSWQPPAGDPRMQLRTRPPRALPSLLNQQMRAFACVCSLSLHPAMLEAASRTYTSIPALHGHARAPTHSLTRSLARLPTTACVRARTRVRTAALANEGPTARLRILGSVGAAATRGSTPTAASFAGAWVCGTRPVCVNNVQSHGAQTQSFVSQTM